MKYAPPGREVNLIVCLLDQYFAMNRTIFWVKRPTPDNFRKMGGGGGGGPPRAKCHEDK